MSAAREGSGLAVSVSRLVPADPDSVWSVVTDITTIGNRSPETVGARWLDATGAPVVGARFKGRNRIRFLRWSTVAGVTDRAEHLRAGMTSTLDAVAASLSTITPSASTKA